MTTTATPLRSPQAATWTLACCKEAQRIEGYPDATGSVIDAI